MGSSLNIELLVDYSHVFLNLEGESLIFNNKEKTPRLSVEFRIIRPFLP